MNINIPEINKKALLLLYRKISLRVFIVYFYLKSIFSALLSSVLSDAIKRQEIHFISPGEYPAELNEK